MKKIIRSLISCLMASTLLFTVSIPAFANSENTKLNDVKKQISQNLVEENIDASVNTIEFSETTSLLDYLKAKNEISDLNVQLKSDKYTLDNTRSAAFEILYNTSTDAIILAFEFYENKLNDTIVVTHIYDETTDTIAFTYAQKITSDSKVSDYFVNNNIPTNNQPSTTFYKSKDVSFLCGLSSTVACGAFSAMLFAFVPASIAVGMSCSAAFAWVCSHA